MQKPIDQMSDAERRAYIETLRAERAILLASAAETAQAVAETPEPVAVTNPDKYPTKAMRKALRAFDEMTDSEQLDHVRQIWGQA